MQADNELDHDVDICKAPPNDVHVVASLLKSYIRNCRFLLPNLP